MKQWHELLQEHLLIRGLLDQLEVFIIEQDEIDLDKLSRTLSNIDTLWNAHEEKEEKFLKKISDWGVNLPNEKMIIEEHREIRGHWKILQKSLKSKNKQEVLVTLDTDGKMVIEKFRSHMAREEGSIQKALMTSNPLPNQLEGNF
ncbi:hypothetical protein COU57_04815 [Candidatus Pacearchaeota archaeon CG10_big_fil_rev_8_21_14_0_10_32_14]|nr:MAG: hypothetical protein COU57_04815 [Candidatus Pacearchaeota archaeon CG10_big_fil_rev_8_21_14_0_10_32_14]